MIPNPSTPPELAEQPDTGLRSARSTVMPDNVPGPDSAGSNAHPTQQPHRASRPSAPWTTVALAGIATAALSLFLSRRGRRSR